MHIKLRCLGLFLTLLGFSTPARADWTLNLGYHNPLYSKLGVNFLYWGSQWNFEVGIGWVDADAEADDDKDEEDKDDDKVSAAVAGDINLKYRFTNGGISPYIQGGFATWAGASVGDDTGADANVGGPFVGVGLFMGKPAFHVYVSGNYLVDSEDTQVQAGLGFDI
jgi:hypothetical protein